MPRMQLTAREAELVEAFRTERNIYNRALSDALAAIGSLHETVRVLPDKPWAEKFGILGEKISSAILALRKED